MLFNRIAIVGLGLMGGSFALAARRAALASTITGWGSEDSLEYALAHKVIDEVERSFQQGRQSEADFVYLATPVGAIIEFLRTRGDQIKPGAIITDVGSTKREICDAARVSLPGNLYFIGGHPMAGSHRTGIESASAEIFQDAPYAVMTDGGAGSAIGNGSSPLDVLLEVVRAIGARPVLTMPDRHDRAVARISHVPQLLSTALAVAVAEKGDEESARLASTGFADMTRLAESSWSVWEDVWRTNADEIVSALDEVIMEVGSIRSALADANFSALAQKFRQANEFTRDRARQR